MVQNVCTCLVSFVDSEGIEHTAEVAARSLFEAAARALGEFRGCGMVRSQPGPTTRIRVTVKAPTTRHELTMARLESWLGSHGRTPAEQALKSELRQLLLAK